MSQFNISIQPTNNDNIVKFIANSVLTEAQSYEFKNIDDAKTSPIAQELFYLPFVKTVYISQNFIAIEKFNIVSWSEVQEEVASAITDYLNSGKNVVIAPEVPKKIPVTIYAESTPNPEVIKFVANKPLVEGIFEFKNIEEAVNAPIAKALFAFPYVKEIFLSHNYVSVTKDKMSEWQEITMELREFIRVYIENGNSILIDKIQNKDNSKEIELVDSNLKTHTALDKEIITILDEYIKPAVESDGGHIAFDSYNDESKTVSVILQGACSGCPSSTVTLKNGIENLLKEMLPGKVLTVEAING